MSALLGKAALPPWAISNPEVFWGDIVNPTWIEGSTTVIGYTRVMANRIAALRLAPEAPKSEIEAAASRFVAMYLSSSRIDPRWRPVLARLREHPVAITVVATDHYAEATVKIIDYLNSWDIPARKAGTDAPSPFSPASNFFVANSADLGVWKADRRFWEILKSLLPLAAVRRILLIDDFGSNEGRGDSYSGQAKVMARQEKTIANIRETFEAAVEAVPFCLSCTVEGSNKAEAGLIAETSARIDEFLERT